MLKILLVDSNDNRRKRLKNEIKQKYIDNIVPWTSVRNENGEYIDMNEYDVLFLHQTDILKEEEFLNQLSNFPKVILVFSGGIIQNEIKENQLLLNDAYFISNINLILNLIINKDYKNIIKIYETLFSSQTKKQIETEYRKRYYLNNIKMVRENSSDVNTEKLLTKIKTKYESEDINIPEIQTALQ